MILWVDAQLSPALAPWISENFRIECSVRRLGLRDSADEEIFRAGRDAQAIVMTKDADFVRLLEQYGPPPQVLWILLGTPRTPGCAKFYSGRCRRPSSCSNLANRW